MKKSYLCFLACGLLTFQAFAQGSAITVWPKGTPPSGSKQRLDFGDHEMQTAHRVSDGKAELHQTKADVIVVQSGSATLVSGGEVLDPVTTAANEIQGSGIRGGATQVVGPGDIIDIPAGTPHQFFVPPGTQITYFVVKVLKR